MVNPEYCDYNETDNIVEIGFTNEKAEIAIKIYLTKDNTARLSSMIRDQVSYGAMLKRDGK